MMAKAIDKKKLVATLKAFEKEYGVGSIFSLDSEKSTFVVDRWSTGLEDLDNILGGGIPYGRFIELFGPESAGKTTLAYHLLAQHEVAVDIPIEGTFDAKRAKIFGNKKGQLFIRRCEYGEQCMETIQEISKANVPLVVIDSVPSMITRKEFEEDDMEKEGQRGRIAALLATKLPKLVTLCEQSGTTVIFINQLRDEMKAGLFGPQTHTPGGRALKHFASIRLQVNRMSWIEVPNKNPANSAAKEIIGMIMKVKVIKSKVCNPLGECTLAIVFDRGFVPVDDVPQIRKEIMKQRNQELKRLRAEVEEDEDDE